ncbi:MAG: hypothetical protein OEM49_14775 [Myxococcales bacterium]|nr:hypothetical protein [Myxococcales bacterium]MDH5307580.1 hypothetical protein [Myxococcales bacterium]MDH5565752.1 hypothetical protein [Myxococcales bacterium]
MDRLRASRERWTARRSGCVSRVATRGTGARVALALGVALLLASSASASAAQSTLPAQALSAPPSDARAWRGVFCTPASSRTAAPWNAAAFAATLLTMAWLARRRSEPHP